VELRTDRLILRDPVLEDWRGATGFLGDREVVKWVHLGPEPKNEQQAKEWLAELERYNAQEPRESYNFLIVEADSDRAVGWIGMGPPSVAGIGDLDFGYALAKECWGRGYMQEAVAALLHFGFTTLGAKSIFASTRVDNAPSASVLERSGLRRRSDYIDETGQPMSLYTISHRGWTAHLARANAS
jgi:ribosomal-protein-alanine N-acetyltransferase